MCGSMFAHNSTHVFGSSRDDDENVFKLAPLEVYAYFLKRNEHTFYRHTPFVTLHFVTTVDMLQTSPHQTETNIRIGNCTQTVWTRLKKNPYVMVQERAYTDMNKCCYYCRSHRVRVREVTSNRMCLSSFWTLTAQITVKACLADV